MVVVSLETCTFLEPTTGREIGDRNALGGWVVLDDLCEGLAVVVSAVGDVDLMLDMVRCDALVFTEAMGSVLRSISTSYLQTL